MKALKRNSNKKILVIALALVTLPILVYLLTKGVALLTSRAASVNLTLTSSTQSLSAGQSAKLNLNANSGTTQILFGQVEVTYDGTKLGITQTIRESSKLRRIMQDTSESVLQDCRTNNCKIVLSAGKDPNDPAVSGTFDMLEFWFVPRSTTANDTTTVQVNTQNSYFVSNTGSKQSVSNASLALTLNPVTNTSTVAPTVKVTSGLTPTSVPSTGSCTHTIDNSISGSVVKPGDVICVKSGTIGTLNLTGITGSATSPVIIKNTGGQVVITGGVTIERSKYFRFTGTGDQNVQYGFKVETSGYTGLRFVEGASDYELDHVEISGAKGTTIGMGLHTSAGAFTQANFTQRNTRIHDNYIHNVKGEGMYIGKNNTLDGKEPILEGLWVYNNKVSYVGRDGINVKGTPRECYIYNNQVDHDTQGRDTGQQGGITAVLNTQCDIYNNRITDGFGPGIQDNGKGGNRIYNNTIINAGQGWSSNQGFGIHVQCGHPGAEKVTISGNTVTNPLLKPYELGCRGVLQ